MLEDENRGIAQQPKIHRFTLPQYYELGELGLLDERTELVEGIVIDMEPIGPWHAGIGDVLSRIFHTQARDRFREKAAKWHAPDETGSGKQFYLRRTNEGATSTRSPNRQLALRNEV